MQNVAIQPRETGRNAEPLCLPVFLPELAEVEQTEVVEVRLHTLGRQVTSRDPDPAGVQIKNPHPPGLTGDRESAVIVVLFEKANVLVACGCTSETPADAIEPVCVQRGVRKVSRSKLITSHSSLFEVVCDDLGESVLEQVVNAAVIPDIDIIGPFVELAVIEYAAGKLTIIARDRLPASWSAERPGP